MPTISLALLAFALSLDSLTVGLLYGLRGIRLPWSAMLVISLATGLFLAAAMGGGDLLAQALPAHAARRLGALLLIGAGCFITYQTWRSHGRTPLPEPQERTWRLKLGSVGIVIQILREPGAADVDRSGHISLSEACFLGVALAVDSVAAGLGAAMAGFSPVGLPFAAASGSLLLMLVGSRAGRSLPLRLEGRWAIMHGLLLVLIGLYRMMMA